MQQATLLQSCPVELVIFDCDGVLIDSEYLSRQVLLKLLSKLGATVSSDYFAEHFLGRNYAHVRLKIAQDYALDLPDQFQEDYQNALMRTFTEQLTPTVELEHMLLQLTVPYCVATSSSPQRVSHALNVTGLMRFFEGRIFTCSEVENGKPAPDIFLHAAKKMGFCPSKCLVLEDSDAGIQAAKAANMRVIKYAGASHLIDSDASDAKIQHNVPTIKHWDSLLTLVCNVSPGIVK